MKAFAQALDLKDDPAIIAEYDQWHHKVWPEVTGALKAIGLTNMRIFRVGNRLFMTFDAPDDFDPARDYQAYAENPRCREWDEFMRKFQQTVPGTPAGQWWAPMKLVFDLAWF